MTDPNPNGTREQIHLSRPSLLPVATAVGLTVAIFGLTLVNPGELSSWGIVALGGLIVLVAALRWIRVVRQEMDSLPFERR